MKKIIKKRKGNTMEKFNPQWKGCLEIFNNSGTLDAFQNAQVHYKKHVIIGKEWDVGFPFEEYIPRAKNHLNSTDEESFVEFCQIEDGAVVKCNLDTIEIGIAQKESGKIKTFFCSDNMDYIYRKLDNGLWGDPSLDQNAVKVNLNKEFDDDETKNYLFNKIYELSLSLSMRAENILIEYLQNPNLDINLITKILSDLGKCRFLCNELYSRILTEEQAVSLHTLRKKFLKAEVILEIFEQRINNISELIQRSIKQQILDQKNLWNNSFQDISSIDDLEIALDKRDDLSYLLIELKILNINDRFVNIDTDSIKLLAFKNDIYLKKSLYIMVDKYNYKNLTILVYPEEFFWRKI
ncbi:MAG: hypothetical protein WCL18_11150 [bacterium]